MTSLRGLPRLVFLEGPRQGEELVFDCDEVSIGRSSENMVILNEPIVSRNHALIRRLESGYEIEDLRSNNGTLVNGKLISGKCQLSQGDQVAIGSSLLRFELASRR